MRKQVNRALAILFVGFICLVMVLTLAKYGRNYAYGFFKSYTDQLKADNDIFDRMSARVYKLNYNAEKRLWGRDTLRHLSARAQMLPGKHLVNIADFDMVKLKSGGYYNVLHGPYDPTSANNVIAFAQMAEEKYGAKSLVVYCHSGLYEEDLLPGETDAYDNLDDYSRLILEDLAKAGLPVTDSRDTYVGHGFTMDKAVNKSDMHWTHLLALNTACDTVKTLNDAFGLGLDETALDESRFTLDLYPKRLNGEFARRIGDASVDNDDVYVLYPAYDTHILYEERGTPEATREGSFRDAVIKYENLECDEGKDYSSDAYYIYGHYLAQTHTHNDAAVPLKVLVIKDSFGSTLSAFLSLAIGDVYAVDPRSTTESMESILDAVQPDILIFACCAHTLSNAGRTGLFD